MLVGGMRAGESMQAKARVRDTHERDKRLRSTKYVPMFESASAPAAITSSRPENNDRHSAGHPQRAEGRVHRRCLSSPTASIFESNVKPRRRWGSKDTGTLVLCFSAGRASEWAHDLPYCQGDRRA